MSGMTFGQLTVLSYYETKTYGSGQHKIYWKCKCDCGSFAIVEGHQLRSGKTQSCGCVKNRGEKQISNYLTNHGIQYKQNKRLNGLMTPTGGYPLMDFQILKDGCVVAAIEMQGVQHYVEDKYNPSFGKYEREVTDPIKREFCKNNSIPLYEIRYDDDIEKRMEEIINTLHADTVPRLDNE